MKRIYITGCAKSGTTLLARMFHAFERTWVIRDETSVETFCGLQASAVGDYDVVVAKRGHASLMSNSRLTALDIARQEWLLQRTNVHIVNIMRDGRDVVRSWYDDWGIWAAFEWMQCIDAYAVYCDATDHRLRILNVRYEDILRTPDAVQSRVEAFTGLKAWAPWSHYPRFVPEDTMFATQYRLRDLDPTRIAKDPEFYRSRRPQDIEYFDKLLKQYKWTT